MATSSFKKINLPLPADMRAALFDEARRTDVPATRLARSAIEDWLEKRRQERRREEIKRFAEQYAGGEYDLDPALEAVAADEMLHYDETDNETR